MIQFENAGGLNRQQWLQLASEQVEKMRGSEVRAGAHAALLAAKIDPGWVADVPGYSRMTVAPTEDKPGVLVVQYNGHDENDPKRLLAVMTALYEVNAPMKDRAARLRQELEDLDRQKREMDEAQIFRTMASYAPAFGMLGTLLGLKSADAASLDVVTVYGGNRLTQLRKVRAIAALPSVLNALQIAAPAALLGAILGEYVGGVRQGVGLALMIAQTNLDVERAWALGLLCAAVAGAAYAAFGLIGRLLTPWSKGGA